MKRDDLERATQSAVKDMHFLSPVQGPAAGGASQRLSRARSSHDNSHPAYSSLNHRKAAHGDVEKSGEKLHFLFRSGRI